MKKRLTFDGSGWNHFWLTCEIILIGPSGIFVVNKQVNKEITAGLRIVTV